MPIEQAVSNSIVTLDAPAEKRCGHCGVMKPASDFYPNRFVAGGLQSWCKACCLIAKRKPPRQPMDLRSRFERLFAVRENGCWEWTGARTLRRNGEPAGYGQFGEPRSDGPRRQRTRLAHRVAWELYVGPVPDDMQLDHLCSNPACVNPRHLEPVTHQENISRAVARRDAMRTRPPALALAPSPDRRWRFSWPGVGHSVVLCPEHARGLVQLAAGETADGEQCDECALVNQREETTHVA